MVLPRLRPRDLWLRSKAATDRICLDARRKNPDAGRHEIEYYGCASCHIVPGVAGAQGLIGPSLQGVENRNYIGGVVQNSPDKLIRWIQNAPSLNPKTAMPDLEIPDQPARDIASYLYTLQ